MSMYFVGIDISKYKHDCCILSAADQNVVSKFTIKNDMSGFEQLITTLHSLSNPEDIKIGFESTAHYALNLELFLENAHHSFMEINPFLIKEYKKSTSLRRTKTDSVDCECHRGHPGGSPEMLKRNLQIPLAFFRGLGYIIEVLALRCFEC